MTAIAPSYPPHITTAEEAFERAGKISAQEKKETKRGISYDIRPSY